MDAELTHIVNMMSEAILRGMGRASLHALKVGLESLALDGVGGVISMQIPSRADGKLDCMFSVGAVNVSSTWGDQRLGHRAA